jgi:hypothetical protein
MKKVYCCAQGKLQLHNLRSLGRARRKLRLVLYDPLDYNKLDNHFQTNFQPDNNVSSTCSGNLRNSSSTLESATSKKIVSFCLQILFSTFTSHPSILERLVSHFLYSKLQCRIAIVSWSSAAAAVPRISCADQAFLR